MSEEYVLRVDAEMYDLIRRYAKAHKMSMAEASRELALMLKSILKKKEKDDIRAILSSLL